MAEELLHIQLHPEDGSFWATVDEYPGVFATGDDLDELRESLEEGISLVAREVRLGPLEPLTATATAAVH